MTTSNEPAATPAVADTTPAPDTNAATPAATTTNRDDDGFVDLDAATSEEEVSDIEDGTLSETAEEELAPEPAETPEQKREKLSGAQRAKLEKQRLLDEIAARDRELEALRASRTTKQPAATPAADDPDMPKEEDFNGNYFAFTEAKAAYVAAKAAREAAEGVFRSREDAAAAERRAEEDRVVSREHAERVETAKEVITDFDTVMEGMKGVNVRDDLLDEIKRNPGSAVIAYHLAKNPSELEAINRMTPLQTAREIARLGATLKLPEPKKQTSAPPPLSNRNKGGSQNANRGQEAVLSNWLDKRYGQDRKR